ncbi:uncharacterized protein LOC120537076 [Polypterus senegalus]|uniref:uncharacterized protein LOC120537076 n=1 Tax=Polypterus senegalus TaxID=55291 RepID=UPI001965729E|nr:uncharacterized protein LOC120537076 [Polypterus senegalus]XP_039621648.1 uncharacterized protein LOC120537076 [Polypterus senegalus]XP_039621650.1 uncharacterized protein LOC120537076 [Polypterus senegalus]
MRGKEKQMKMGEWSLHKRKTTRKGALEEDRLDEAAVDKEIQKVEMFLKIFQEKEEVIEYKINKLNEAVKYLNPLRARTQIAGLLIFGGLVLTSAMKLGASLQTAVFISIVVTFIFVLADKKSFKYRMRELKESTTLGLLEVGLLASGAAEALLWLSKIPESSAQGGKIQRFLKVLRTEVCLRKLMETVSELSLREYDCVEGTTLSAQEKIFLEIFPHRLDQLYSMFEAIIEADTDQDSELNSRRICECAEKLQENLKAIHCIYSELTKFSKV